MEAKSRQQVTLAGTSLTRCVLNPWYQYVWATTAKIKTALEVSRA